MAEELYNLIVFVTTLFCVYAHLLYRLMDEKDRERKKLLSRFYKRDSKINITNWDVLGARFL